MSTVGLALWRVVILDLFVTAFWKGKPNANV